MVDGYLGKPQRAGAGLGFCVEPDVPASTRLERSIPDVMGSTDSSCWALPSLQNSLISMELGAPDGVMVQAVRLGL